MRDRGFRSQGGILVLDLLLLVLLAVAFVGAVGYVRACDDLTRTNGTAGDQAP
jgi:hypothetical protein